MAQKTKNIKEALVMSVDEEVPTAISEILDSFQSDIPTDEPPVEVESLKPKMVKVQALRKFQSCIGKTWYYGEKDLIMLVPNFVADQWMKDIQHPRIRFIV